MQVLTDKNSQLSQELDECKAQLGAVVAALKESEKGPLETLVSIAKNTGTRKYAACMQT